MRAFWELSSCRQFGQVVGPIPWNLVAQYGERKGLDVDMLNIFEVVIRTLDETYLSWERQDQERRERSEKDKQPRVVER